MAKKTTDEQLSLEPSVAPELNQTTEQVVQNGDADSKYCRVHNCRLIASASRKSHTEYKCRVPGCQTQAVVMRPEVPAPTEPLACPMCAGKRDADDNPTPVESFCEVDTRKSGFATLHMSCPNCHWSTKVPRPDAVAGHAAAQKVAERRGTLLENYSSRI